MIRTRFIAGLVALSALMAACGDENGEGSGGSLLSGFSLIIVIIVVIVVVLMLLRNRRS